MGITTRTYTTRKSGRDDGHGNDIKEIVMEKGADALVLFNDVFYEGDKLRVENESRCIINTYEIVKG